MAKGTGQDDTGRQLTPLPDTDIVDMTFHPARIGLALGAGAARGWSHIGAIERLEEAGIAPAVISGTSIGALVGGLYAAGRLAELKEFALSITRRRLFSFLDISWGGSGLISGQKLDALLSQQIKDLSFSDIARPFICIATEMLTGHEIWLRKGPLAPAIRASYALPGIFPAVYHEGQWLIDGAVVNPIPVSACRAMGSRLVIAINLNSDAFAGTVIQQLDTGAGAARRQGQKGKRKPRAESVRQIVGSREQPGLTTVLMAAFNISQDRLARSRLAGDPADIVITPRTPDIALFEFDRAADAIAAGRQAVERALPEIEATLNVLDRAING